ncbi:xNopp180 protein, putative [Trichomonas vaginalis G3]|uniref:XNopp180 protein, putative n=1 Tax=Trichomonas vaginalis (strain ATCC PRA-98 / G3) TaxID=412133 RepID=A2DS78_TRIV3|nr:hypothetical protein TVAGG3_0078510 [Trichomonas vaginalis G3]EAY16657.1 xNopp180 protein, putative [Trichomonas vaginalis G3]KAI5543073.1 hypothetical protein TVAGG3_0078510 [Trichomonas vaginalis G3]|eukprot:XP_001328880.1 xNopp180 protein [Trichomonas vaginalis G3]
MSNKEAVLEEMQKNGTNCKLQAEYVTEISKLIQTTSIDSLKMTKNPNNEQKFLLANSIILQYLNKFKCNYTIDSMNAETKNWVKNSKSSPEKDIELPNNELWIKSILKLNTEQQKQKSKADLRAKVSDRIEKATNEPNKQEKAKPQQPPAAKEQPKAKQDKPAEEPKKSVTLAQPVTPQNVESESDSNSYISLGDIEDVSKPSKKSQEQPAAKPTPQPAEKPAAKPAAKPVNDIPEDSFGNFSDLLEDSKPEIETKPAAKPAPAPAAKPAPKQEKKQDQISSDLNFSFADSIDSGESPVKPSAPKKAEPARKPSNAKPKDEESSDVMDFDGDAVPVEESIKEPVAAPPPKKEAPPKKVEKDSMFADLDFDSNSTKPSPPPKSAAAKPAANQTKAKPAATIDETSSMNFDFDDFDDIDEKPTKATAKKPEPAPAPAPKPASKPAAPAAKPPPKEESDSDIDVDFSDQDFDL